MGINTFQNWLTLISEEVFEAAKGGYSAMGKFFQAVANEIGTKRALELWGSSYEHYGPALDEMFRTQSLEEFGVNMGVMMPSLGLDSKISRTSNSVLATTRRCPEYDGYKEAGRARARVQTLVEMLGRDVFEL